MPTAQPFDETANPAMPPILVIPDFEKMKKKDLIEWASDTVKAGQLPEQEFMALRKLRVAELKAKLKARFPTGQSLEDPDVTGFDANDPLHLIIAEVTNIDSEAAAIEAVSTAQQDEGTSSFRIGGILSKMQAEDWKGEHDNFFEFAEATFGFRIRKSQTLIQIYRAMVSINATGTMVSTVGWTKLRILVPLIGLGIITPENLNDWLEKARACSHLSLKDEVAAAKQAAAAAGDAGSAGPNGAGGPAVTSDEGFETRKFRVPKDTAQVVDAAIDRAKQDGSTDHDGVALGLVCISFCNAGMVPAPGAAPAAAPAAPAQSFDEVDIGALFQHIHDTRGDEALQELFDFLTDAYPGLEVDVFPGGYPIGYYGYGKTE